MSCLNDKYLRKCLNVKLGKHQFKNTVLPKFMDYLENKLNEKLVKAKHVYLIIDLWLSRSFSHFLAVGAIVKDHNLKKELLIIGFDVINQKHTAENITELIENILNKYNFDKSKIVSVTIDEGRNIQKILIRFC